MQTALHANSSSSSNSNGTPVCAIFCGDLNVRDKEVSISWTLLVVNFTICTKLGVTKIHSSIITLLMQNALRENQKVGRLDVSIVL